MSILDVAHRIDEKIWFEAFQPLLLRMARTNEGRALMGLPQNLPMITKLSPSSILAAEYDYGILQCRSGSVYAREIRKNWKEFQKFAQSFYETEMNGKPATMLLGPIFAFGAHAIFTFYPVPGQFSPVDGRVSYFNSDPWNTTHNAANGTDVLDTNDSLMIGAQSGDFGISRTIIVFNTVDWPDAEEIDSAKGSLYINSVTNTDDDGTDYIAVVSAAPASNSALALGDYDSLGTTPYSDSIDLGTISSSATEDWTLNATGIAAIDVDGFTQLGMREGHDIENATPSGNNTIDAASADDADPEKAPKLELTYVASGGGGIVAGIF